MRKDGLCNLLFYGLVNTGAAIEERLILSCG